MKSFQWKNLNREIIERPGNVHEEHDKSVRKAVLWTVFWTLLAVSCVYSYYVDENCTNKANYLVDRIGGDDPGNPAYHGFYDACVRASYWF